MSRKHAEDRDPVEVALHGGEINDVVRVGDTVRRTGGPWSRTIHALLKHLASVGFDAAPRALGFDDHGREILSFMDGEVISGNKTVPSYLWTDDTLVAAARLLRRLHDATESFVPPLDATWWWPVNSRPGRRVVCHGDFAPWNIVFRNGVPVGVIDWDLAAPGPATADVAWALWFFVPLRSGDHYRPTLSMSVTDRARRIRLFCDAYGLSNDERVHILEDVLVKHDEVINGVKLLADLGSKGYQRLRDAGHEDMHQDRAFLLANMSMLTSLLTQPPQAPKELP